MARDVQPEVDARVSDRVRQAAERGEREVMLFTLPSESCTDGGRAINSFDPAWPGTLTRATTENKRKAQVAATGGGSYHLRVVP